MGIFDAIGDAAGWVGHQTVEHWDDIAVGVATGVATMTLGPVGGALVGAAASGLQTKLNGGSWSDVGESAALGGFGGLLGGGVLKGAAGAFGIKGFIRSEGKNISDSLLGKAAEKMAEKAIKKGIPRADALADAKKAMAFNKDTFWKGKVPTWAGAGQLTPGRYYMAAAGAAQGPTTTKWIYRVGKDAYKLIKGGHKNGVGDVPVVDITTPGMLKYV